MGNNQHLNPWTDEEIKLLHNNILPNESWSSFWKREIPHRTLSSVVCKGRKLGINNNHYRSRKYSFNNDIWKEPTPESCYWAAWIATDGCITSTNRTGESFSLKIDLQESDSHVLERFKEFCSYTGPLRKVRQKGNSRTIELCIAISKGWVDDLKKYYNITPRKTHTLQPPNIKDKYLKECFLLGAIEGDGHVGRSSKRGCVYISFSSASPEMGQWVQNMFDDMTFGCAIIDTKSVKESGKRKLPKIGNAYIPHVGGNSACALIDYFRQFPLSKLDRKWNNPKIVEYIESKKLLYPDKFLTLEIPPQYR